MSASHHLGSFLNRSSLSLSPMRPVGAPNFVPAAQSGLVQQPPAGLPLNPLTNTAAAPARLPFAPTPSALPARPNLPDDPVIPINGFVTHEEAEKAFMHLLKKAGVDPTWTWDATMRAIITDPLYKALGTLAEKKAAWQKVCHFLETLSLEGFYF